MIKLYDFFEQERKAGESLVLAIVTKTEGSTYRKPGAFMLLSSSGRRAGLLSGGCLEGDLHEHAIRMLAEDRHCMTRRYDNRSSDDPIWGLGLGCEGSMDILLLRCSSKDRYEPLAFLFEKLSRHETANITINLNDGSHTLDSQSTEKSTNHFLMTVSPPLRLLICGAGPDAEPLLDFAQRLGWQTTLIDHRAAYLSADRFAGARLIKQVDLDNCMAEVDLDTYSAAVVMSHHLIADERYLRGLAISAIPYVGLLGPPARRERLIAELGEVANLLTPRLHAPVGLNLGGRTPEAIALSIAAEIQKKFSPNAV